MIAQSTANITIKICNANPGNDVQPSLGSLSHCHSLAFARRRNHHVLTRGARMSAEGVISSPSPWQNIMVTRFQSADQIGLPTIQNRNDANTPKQMQAITKAANRGQRRRRTVMIWPPHFGQCLGIGRVSSAPHLQTIRVRPMISLPRV